MRRRRRRRRKSRGLLPAVVALVAVAAISWWMYPREAGEAQFEPLSLAAKLPEPIEEPPPAAAATPQQGDVNPGSSALAQAPADRTPEPPPLSATPSPPVMPTPATSAPTENGLEAGKQALARNDLVGARKSFNDVLSAGLGQTPVEQARAQLIRLGNDLIFSGRTLPNDPLVDRYVIKIGDSLAKIANQYAVTSDLLASLNGIADKNRIREGQTIKVIRGPMHAVVYKREYRLDVFVGDVLVRSFPVGLGMDDSTPTGEWRVRNKLENPTYYPPRGGAIVSADDPENPLGERWIGLEGVSGEAVAQERYGIHGTNEPNSIGKSVSLGCVRLHNADVEQLYTYLVEGKSRVTILE